MQLTEAGEVLIDHVRPTQKSFERTRTLIDEMKSSRRERRAPPCPSQGTVVPGPL